MDASKYDIVKAKFDNYFDAIKNVIYEQAQFMGQIQQSNELTDDFITALYVLVERSSCRKLKEKILRGCQVTRLSDLSLSERLQMNPDLKLQKTVDLARSSERTKTTSQSS